MLDEIMSLVGGEIENSQARYGDYHSTHEALGVLVEEMAELTEAIRLNHLNRIQREALQVAAVATKLAWICAMASEAFTKRSGIK